MKAINEFNTEEEYLSYLRIYFSGQILASWFSQPNNSENDIRNTYVIKNIIFASDELIKTLKKNL